MQGRGRGTADEGDDEADVGDSEARHRDEQVHGLRELAARFGPAGLELEESVARLGRV